MKFTKEEIIHIGLSAIILAIVFGFNDGQDKFTLSFWLLNFLKVLIFSSMAILVHILGQKYIAKIYNCKVEYRIWKITRYWFRERSTFKDIFGTKGKITALPIGVILAIILTLISNGKFFFVAIGSYMVATSAARLGRRYVRLTNFEDGQIALAGPLANIFLAFILQGITQYTSLNLSAFVIMNCYIAAWHMFPMWGLSGAKVWLGGRTFYIFSLIFILLVSFLLTSIGVIASLILALIFASAFALFFHIKFRS